MAKPTISDVARLSGASMKTVSRVVNNEASISKQMRERVHAAINELGYRPSQTARALASKKSYMLGLIYDQLSPSYLMHVQGGLLSVCNTKGYGLSLCPLSINTDEYLQSLNDWLARTRVDGVVLTPPFGTKDAVIDCLQKSNVKAVALSENAPGVIESIAVDEIAAARELTKHLIEKGHKSIGFIQGPADHQSSVLRYKGYCMEMNAHGLNVSMDRVYAGDFTYESGLAAARSLLASKSPPTALFAANDDMAAAVINAAHELNLNVPQDLAVVGFDDAPLASQVWPPLTTVNQPVAEMAALAGRHLIENLSGDKKTKAQAREKIALLPFKLCVRDSS